MMPLEDTTVEDTLRSGLTDDPSDQRLVENVHPPDWINPEPAQRYNLVVVGAGSAGLVTAAGAAGLGAKVALVERHLMGGDCLNFGCVPSKGVIRAGRAAAAVRQASQFGVDLPEGWSVDFAAAMERVRKVRAKISTHDSAQRFRSLGIDVFLGDGRFTGPDTLQVGGQTLRFSRACIATGARALQPDIPGLAEAGFYTNETIFSMISLPPRLAVLGSGPLGCELAQAFARLGSEVTIIERGAQFLPKEDRDAAEVVARAFQRDGIRCVFNAQVKQVTPGTHGKQLLLTIGGEDWALEVDAILVGYGRVPNVHGLGLEASNVQYDTRHGIKVDDRLRTTNKRIYAAGDVCLKHKFTHTADATARIVIQNALFWGRKKLSALNVPWCTYTDPEVAHVGLYEKEARQRGIDVDTFTKEFKDNDRALTDGDEEGFVRIHVKKGTDRIVGATIVGPNAGELISELSVAMAGRVGLGKLADVIHPYPTLAEAIKGAGDAYNRARLTPLVAGLFKHLFRWQR